MSHWRINDVPCCLSPWTGSKLSELELEKTKTAFKCSCSRIEFSSMAAALEDLFPDEKFDFSYHEDSCPGDRYWDEILFKNRVKALNDWFRDKEGYGAGWSVDEKFSTDELFIVSSSFEKVYVVELPDLGWSFVYPTKLTNKLLGPPDLNDYEYLK